MFVCQMVNTQLLNQLGINNGMGEIRILFLMVKLHGMPVKLQDKFTNRTWLENPIASSMIFSQPWFPEGSILGLSDEEILLQIEV